MKVQAKKLVARQPQQQRSRERVAAIIEAAEALILEAGLEGCTIVALAERLGCPRGNIYLFFPTPLALYNELAARHLAALEMALAEQAEYIRAAPEWREAVRRLVAGTAQYFQQHPVANRVVLGPLSDSGYRAWETTIAHLGSLLTAMLKSRGVELVHHETDTGALAIEFAAASLRLSYYQHGTVTPAYAESATEVIIAFLQQRVLSEVGTPRPARAAVSAGLPAAPRPR